MTKEDNIFELYDKLNKSGARGEAAKYIANLCGVKVVTVKGHWLVNRQFPDYVEDGVKDEIIAYLQNVNLLQNKLATSN